jgi:sigma-B regulation protein RsbU (phosphoserine phosphatase)
VLERGADGAPRVIRTAIFDASVRREYERELLRAKQRAEDSEAHSKVLARALQQTLIPPAPPAVPGLDLAAVYRPAGSGDEIGGDFYDIFELAEGDWVFAIGDVCGKGVHAAVVTAVARHTIRAAAVRGGDLSEVLQTLNEVLLREESQRFCTAALVRTRTRGGTVTASITSAGHPLALLARPGVAAVNVGAIGTLLGVLREPTFANTDVPLRSGDRVVLFTDGVTEARRDREFFGDSRLREAIGRHDEPAAVTAGRILQSVLDFQRGNPRDDIVVMVLRVP